MVNRKYAAAVLTVSDRCSRGERHDASGPAIRGLLERNGYEVIFTALVPDDMALVSDAIIKSADRLDAALVITVGGTGFSPRDVTPEATRMVIEKEAPGIAELMRAQSMKLTPRGCLSRSVSGIRGRSLIINLPGSEKAAMENLLAVIEPIEHGLQMLRSEGASDCAAEPRG